jgi:hypothetical protein
MDEDRCPHAAGPHHLRRSGQDMVDVAAHPPRPIGERHRVWVIRPGRCRRRRRLVSVVLLLFGLMITKLSAWNSAQQAPAQVLLAEHRHPIGDLGSNGQHKAFGEAVRAWTPRRNLDHLDARVRQDRVERGRELTGPIADEEPEPGGVVTEVHDDVGRGRRRRLGPPTRGVVSGCCAGARRPRGAARGARCPWWWRCGPAGGPARAPAGRSSTATAVTRPRSCSTAITAGQRPRPDFWHSRGS